MANSNKKVVTEKTFECVKRLQKDGATWKEMIEYLGLSGVTISRMRVAETYEEYKQIVIAAKTGSKAKEAMRKEEERKAAEARKAEEARIAAEAEEAKRKAAMAAMAEQKQVQSANAGGQHMLASSYQVNKLIESVKEQNELLKLISAKLVFIVEQLS